MRLILNPAVNVFPLHGSSSQAMMMCEVPSTGREPFRYAIPALLTELIKLFDGTKDTNEVVAAYQQLHRGEFTQEKIEQLVNGFLIPKGLLISADHSIPSPPPLVKRNTYLYGRTRMLPARAILPLTKPLSLLFSKAIFLSLLPVFVVVHLIYYLWAVPGYQFNINSITGFQFVLATLLTMAAAFFHELGHASALTFYGCEKLEIGVGVYIFIPVLYTDVSQSWTLTTRQRAMIDIGGIYFHCIFLILTLSLFWVTESPVFLYCFFFIDTTIANSLNPFLRMDGYWLVADLFGMFNLRKQSLDLFRYYGARLLGIAPRTDLRKWGLSRAGMLLFCVYAVLSLAFFVYLYQIMITQVVMDLVPAYPGLLLNTWGLMRENPMSISKVASALLEVLWKGLVLFGLGMFAYRGLSKLFSYLQKKLRFRVTGAFGGLRP